MRGIVFGGEGGIRTLDTLLTYTPLAGARLQPLGHFSINLTTVFPVKLVRRARSRVAAKLSLLHKLLMHYLTDLRNNYAALNSAAA